MPPWLIFAGQGWISQQEADELDASGIGWSFQRKAWADGRYSRKWMRAFLQMLKDHDLGEQHLLLLDDLSSQTMPIIDEMALAGGVHTLLIPPGVLTFQCFFNLSSVDIDWVVGCTDLLPVDHHLGARMKQIINTLYKVEVEINYAEWRQYQENGNIWLYLDTRSKFLCCSGTLSASRRRVMMARWVQIAWKHIVDNPKMIHDSFVHTVLIKLDGSHEIKIRGLDIYQPPTVMCLCFCMCVRLFCLRARAHMY
jgi:hypothetical protein